MATVQTDHSPSMSNRGSQEDFTVAFAPIQPTFITLPSGTAIGNDIPVDKNESDTSDSIVPANQKLFKLLCYDFRGDITIENHIFTLLTPYLSQKVGFLTINLSEDCKIWGQSSFPSEIREFIVQCNKMAQDQTVYLWRHPLEKGEIKIFLLAYRRVEPAFIDILTFLSSSFVLLASTPERLCQSYLQVVFSCQQYQASRIHALQSLHLCCNSGQSKPVALTDNHCVQRTYQWKVTRQNGACLLKAYQQQLAVSSNYNEWTNCKTQVVSSMFMDIDSKRYYNMPFTGSVMVQFLMAVANKMKSCTITPIEFFTQILDSILAKLYQEVLNYHLEQFDTHLVSFLPRKRLDTEELWQYCTVAQDMTMDEFQALRMDQELFDEYAQRLTVSIDNRRLSLINQNKKRNETSFENFISGLKQPCQMVDNHSQLIERGSEHTELLIKPLSTINRSSRGTFTPETLKLLVSLRGYIKDNFNTSPGSELTLLRARTIEIDKLINSHKRFLGTNVGTRPYTTERSQTLMNELRELKNKSEAIDKKIQEQKSILPGHDPAVVKLKVRLENATRFLEDQLSTFQSEKKIGLRSVLLRSPETGQVSTISQSRRGFD